MAHPDLLALTGQAHTYTEVSRSANTARAYKADWHDFSSWCVAHQLEHLPATSLTVAAYINAQIQAGKKIATIDRRLVAISQAHKLAGYPSPTADECIHGAAPTQKAPILIETLRER